jgi:hypothetical protein
VCLNDAEEMRAWFGHHAPRIRGSRKYFMATCQYGDKSANGFSRLTAGTVFLKVHLPL